MTREEIRNRIFDLCEIKVDGNKEDLDLVSDLGFSSIQLVQLIISLEKEFNIVFDMLSINIEIFSKTDKLTDLVYKMISEN